VNVENKEQSKQWMHTHSPNKPKKFNHMLSARKLRDGNCFLGLVQIVEFMQQGTTIMTEVYCETLKGLYKAIQNKRHGILTSSVVLLYDKARPRTAART
jgi:hypothetical protein